MKKKLDESQKLPLLIEKNEKICYREEKQKP